MTKEHRYQPFYCEENVWWQVREAGGRRWALFITNASRRVMLWEQRLAPPGHPVLWDYHVVMVNEADGTRAATFPFDAEALPEPLVPFVPHFRLVPAADLEATFATDRSHMQDGDGGYILPPPPWPPVVAGALDSPSTLDRYLDLEDDIAGEVMTLAQLRAWAAG